jgi:hypothetical protein
LKPVVPGQDLLDRGVRGVRDQRPLHETVLAVVVSFRGAEIRDVLELDESLQLVPLGGRVVQDGAQCRGITAVVEGVVIDELEAVTQIETERSPLRLPGHGLVTFVIRRHRTRCEDGRYHHPHHDTERPSANTDRELHHTDSFAPWHSIQPTSASKCFELFHCSTIPGVLAA